MYAGGASRNIPFGLPARYSRVAVFQRFSQANFTTRKTRKASLLQMLLTLPFPPSVNHYYRRVGPRTLISREGREYRAEVCELLAPGGGSGIRKPPAGGRIALAMDAFPPDRRRRDLDNLLKCRSEERRVGKE